jgi:hypothetical protein
MRTSVTQGATQAPLQQTAHLSVQERAELYQAVTGTSVRTGDEPAPNREFDDLWLRFIASVAQFGRRDLAASTGPASRKNRCASSRARWPPWQQRWSTPRWAHATSGR